MDRNPSSPQQPPPEQPVTEQEAQELEAHLRRLAEQWRARLSDPATRREIEAGKLKVSPLVQQLLAAFPPAATRSTGG